MKQSASNQSINSDPEKRAGKLIVMPYKINMINNKLFILFSSIILLFLVQGCSPCSHDEISRIKSPDGKVEVVHVRGNCGATTPYSEHVFVVPVGDKTPEPKGDYQLFLADHVSGLKLAWRESKVLEIHYDEARIFRFSNFWQSKKVDNFGDVVEVRLVPSKADFSLSRERRL